MLDKMAVRWQHTVGGAKTSLRGTLRVAPRQKQRTKHSCTESGKVYWIPSLARVKRVLDLRLIHSENPKVEASSAFFVKEQER